MNKKEFREKILDISKNEDQEELVDYLADVKSSWSDSSKQWRALFVTLIVLCTTHYLGTRDEGESLKILSVELPSSGLFPDIFLLGIALGYSALGTLGYLVRFQRETYDYLKLVKTSVIGKNGLHELRLKGDYVLGQQMLRDHGETGVKIAANFLAITFSYSFLGLPLAYIIVTAIDNLAIQWRLSSIFGVSVAVMTILAVIATAITIRQTNKIAFPKSS